MNVLILIIVVVLVIVLGLWLLFLYAAFRSFDGLTEVEAIKELKRFLGFEFKDDYTVVKFYQETIPDFILKLTISLPDDSFKEITAFLDTLKLEEAETKGYKYGWERVEKTERHTGYYGYEDEEDTNIYRKSYGEYQENYRKYSMLTVDCDNQTLTYEAGSG